jgi:drug/metabolite transporter (DMT)-like permease
LSRSLLANPYLQIHFCVLLWGFTAILGKMITLDAVGLVFWRVLIVSLCLLFWPGVWRQIAGMSRRDLRLAIANGLIITVHWLFFYGSIKAANASVAATCIALAPVFLSIIEPLRQRQRFAPGNLLIAAAAVPGVGLVVGGIPTGMIAGLVLGIFAALFVSVFSLIGKGLAQRVPALALTTVQMVTGTLALGIAIPAWPVLGADFRIPAGQDVQWLVVLAICCTLIPFALTMRVLRKLSAFSVQLAVNLEPVYSIALAILLLGEAHDLQWPFFAGVALILGSVVWHARSSRTLSRRSQDALSESRPTASG